MNFYELFWRLYFKDNEPIENAGFILRLLATMVDLVILLFVAFLLVMLKISPLFYTIILVFYYPLMESSKIYQGTIGKRMFRLKVVDSFGQTLSLQQSMTRLLSKFISLAIVGLGFFMNEKGGFELQLGYASAKYNGKISGDLYKSEIFFTKGLGIKLGLVLLL